MKLTWTLCFLALNADAIDVKLGAASTAVRTKLVVGGKDTGCTSQTWSREWTCKTQDSDIYGGAVPATYFVAIISCTNMDTSAYDSLTVRPGTLCAKMTFTQHMEAGGNVNLNTLQMLPNSIANLTCVVFPLPMSTRSENEGWMEVVLPMDVTGIKKGEDDRSLRWIMGSVKFKSEDLTKVDSGKCLKTVEDSYEWGFRLMKSSQNVHEVLFTSQVEPSAWGQITPSWVSDKYNFMVTKTVKDVALKDLNPKIAQAGCSTASGDFSKQVTLKTFEAPADQNQPKKHEEKVELLVDATQLPKGTFELEVTVEYRIPGVGDTKQAKLMLPVDNPEIPDEPKEKDKSGGVGAGVIAFIVIFAAGAVVAGAFFYRRHQRIQAHAREVLA
eukprot:Skav221748  [mRNA]  locus=scaffold3834:17338:18492:- [translate_table: standard]